ncbi:MAG: MerR family transcriptional regulator [Bacteroidales bacterium]|nr:MerR family transcriptional regulator [Bacteroidales bacterium]
MEELTKKYYKIKDVAELLDLPPSTLRYWESEFSELRPKRNDGKIRLYTPNDIEQLRVIKFLVKDKQLTIEGAREHLRKNRHAISRTRSVIERLQAIRGELTSLLEALDNRQG